MPHKTEQYIVPRDGPPPTLPGSMSGLGLFPPDLFPEYDEFEMVAEGGMGVVFKAHHRELKRFEAVKLVKAGQFANSKELDRFRYEAEATAALDHPNIVSLYRSGETRGLPYFAMKWVEGGDLSTEAANLRPNPRKLARIMAKVARAIAHAHRRGIIHRDLKPANVLLDKDGEPHVTDFGLAKALSDSTAEHRSGFTATGQAVGTPAYIAPEQARGNKVLTTAVDVYGLGAILYELITDRLPFDGDNLADLLRRVMTEPPPYPRAVNPLADPDLEAIAMKCLEKDPADRYASAEDVALDLERVGAGRRIGLRPAPMGEWVRQVLRRQPESFVGYAWEVKLWFGVIMVVSQLAIFALIETGQVLGWVGIVFLMACLVSAVVTQKYMGARFSRLPETEKHSMLVAVGHTLAQIAVVYAGLVLDWNGDSTNMLKLYPAQAAVTGLALIVIGTTHWGRFFYMGLGLIAMVPILKNFPRAAPLVYGGAVAAIMFHWTYAVKVTFAKELNRPRSRSGSTGSGPGNPPSLTPWLAP